MGQEDNVGSIRKVTLGGVTYDVFADSNFSEVGSPYENESVPTSGRPMRKLTRRPYNVESVVLACNGAERVLLEELAGPGEDITLSYQTANGDVRRATGWIEFETRETEEGRAAIQLHPRTNWDMFLA